MDAKWTAMNDLDIAFSNINTISFLLEELKLATSEKRESDVANITDALIAYTPLYTQCWDRKYQEAWNVIFNEGTNQ